MNRREFLISTTAFVAAAASLDRAAFAAAPATTRATTTRKGVPPDDAVWHDVRDWGVEGRGFEHTEAYFDRLPARAKELVRPDVWNLSRQTAGMSVRFETDATEIYIRYALTKDELAMAHMPATGVSGMDIYGQLDGRWHWLDTIRPSSREIDNKLADRIAPGRRAYLINLPLYNGVKSMQIGLPKGAAFGPIAPRKEKPILFYGTSITQGGCASRPGMAFVAILGRKLDRPMLNFGFSGNGRTEVEVARVLADLDPSIFVIDTLANTSPEQLRERAEPLVKTLRAKHPITPILLLDERPWANRPLRPYLVPYHREKSEILKQACANLRAAGDANVYYRTGGDLLGGDGEGTVDGSHPNDLGMMRYADALEPTLRKLLG